jgi:hypothetical protein
MRGYGAMTRTEFRLFRREPFSVVLVLAFPLMMMVLLRLPRLDRGVLALDTRLERDRDDYRELTPTPSKTSSAGRRRSTTPNPADS